MLSNIYRQATRAVQRRVHGVVQELPLLAGPRAHIHTRRFSIDDAGHEKREGSNVQSPTRTIQLRFSVVPESMPDAIRALREVERKYGRIREYRLVRVRA